VHRLLVVSDSHGDIRNLERLRPLLGQIDWLLHAGDHLQDAAPMAASLEVAPERIRAVIGNCDFPLRNPDRAILEIDEVRIMLVHGHLHGVKSRYDRILYGAQEAGARVAIFGHSHMPLLLDEAGVLLLNPGSLSQPRLATDRPSCAIIEIENGQVGARHLFLR
jgi:putative phosphoesterase